MIGLKTIAKMAGGDLDPEAFRELLGSFGADVEFHQVKVSEIPFLGLAETASLPRAEMIEFRGTMKGKRFHALLVTTVCDGGHSLAPSDH
jgi:hypothetical protein